MKPILSASALALLLSACAPSETGRSTMAAPPASSATEMLRNASGQQVASATITQVGDSLRVRLEGMALPPGSHGAHLHAVGVCAAPSFESAGPHWNPTGRQHGKNNPAGMHNGDLGNLTVDASGRGILEYTIPDAAMMGGPAALLDGDGSALVVHASADDNRTDPSGNSGARIACAAFR